MVKITMLIVIVVFCILLIMAVRELLVQSRKKYRKTTVSDFDETDIYKKN